MNFLETALDKNISNVLSPNLRRVIAAVHADILKKTNEIRVRVNKPLLLIAGKTDYMVTDGGHPASDWQQAYICTNDDIQRTFQLISKNSLYALEQELRMGYVTINGGHRIGLAGQAVVHCGEMRTLKNISSMSIRIAHEIKGSSDFIFPYVVENERQIMSTLIISPPRCGKTTLLRDLIRLASSDSPGFKFQGVQVGVVDERSEIAACQNGIPTLDLGQRTDVIDGCPKSAGMLMLIRAMAPQVIATDELGREEDATAIREALNAGVSVIATVHGKNIEEVACRPFIGELIKQKYFDRYIVLDDEPVVGTVSKIIAVKHGAVLYSRDKGEKACG